MRWLLCAYITLHVTQQPLPGTLWFTGAHCAPCVRRLTPQAAAQGGLDAASSFNRLGVRSPRVSLSLVGDATEMGTLGALPNGDDSPPSPPLPRASVSFDFAGDGPFEDEELMTVDEDDDMMAPIL